MCSAGRSTVTGTTVDRPAVRAVSLMSMPPLHTDPATSSSGVDTARTFSLAALVAEREPSIEQLIKERDGFYSALGEVARAAIEDTLATFRIRASIDEISRTRA